MLPIGIVAGIVLCTLFQEVPLLQPYEADAYRFVKTVQPILLFAMLFITFCKVNPKDIRLHMWHLWLLLFQSGMFIALALIILLTHCQYPVIIEATMLAFICPTATAAAVVAGKLGGDIAGISSYTLVINLVVALLIPAFVPLLHPGVGASFIEDFILIINKVFPLLICPFILALIVRYSSKWLLETITHIKDIALYLWAFGLTFAIMVSMKSIWNSGAALWIIASIAVLTAVSCFVQFWLGRLIGKKYTDAVTAGQALGQKNTVFAIWCGYTFFDPLSSISGGFYSVYHNLWNSYQLMKQEEK